MKTKEAIIGFIKKYKIESIGVFIFSILSAIAFDVDKTKPWALFESMVIFSFIAMGTFFVDKIFSIYENEIKQKIGNKEHSFMMARWISYIVVVAVEYLFYIWSICLMRISNASSGNAINFTSTDYESIRSMIMSASIVLTMFTMFVIYFVIKEKRISLKEYLLKLFMNSIFVFIISIIVLMGIYVLYMICEILLGTIPYYIISRIIVFLLSMIYFMGLFVSIENVDGRQSLFSKILVRYIMQIMVFVGFIIFYIYLIKIIVIRELPSNQVFAVCTSLFSIGLFTSLMSLGINEESKYNTAIKFLPIAFIPALILQIISLALRIAQHGMTTNRYFGVMIIVFEIVYLVFYILDELLKNEKVKLKNILIILNIFILIMFFVPKVNSYEFSDIYNKLFKKSQKTETVVNSNTYENKYVIRSKDFNDIEVDIKEYDKIKTFNIYVEYDKNEKKYISINEKEEYDNKTIDISNIINNLENNIKSIDGNNYLPEDVFKDIGYEIVTGNNKMIINHIWMEYNKEIEKIDHLELQGYIVTKDDK